MLVLPPCFPRPIIRCRYLTELKLHGGSNLLENAVSVATVIPTPTITKNQDIIYTTGTSKLAINGTNFREKVRETIA